MNDRKDAMFNAYHLCYQLKMNNRKAEPQYFIRNLSVYPNVIVHMIAQPLIEGLEIVLKMSTKPIMLHYDTVFNMGDFYLSTLLFKHSMFKSYPVILFGFLIHTRRFLEDHLRFMEVIRQSSPFLTSKKIVIVSD